MVGRVGGLLDHTPEMTQLTMAEEWPGFLRVDLVVEAGWDRDGMIEIDAHFSAGEFSVLCGGAVGRDSAPTSLHNSAARCFMCCDQDH